MRLTIFRLIAFSLLLSASIALLLVLSATNGEPGIVTKASAATRAGACKEGTVASYIGTSCSQEQTVFNWQSYTCTSSPQSICDSLGTKGSNLKIRLDPKGPHTLLIGATRLWNVSAGQNVNVTIKGTVSGATTNQNWPHFVGVRGQTGDGWEQNKTTVGCSGRGDCNNGNGISDILCNKDSKTAYCTEQKKIDAYLSERTTFDPAPLDNPYPLTIEIKLNGGANGTAAIYSLGFHVGN
ncbi:MAG TPA: hypothetical protein VH437_08100 [Terriglobales bacterium]|jgi:hypothetical protein